ncbi:MAG: hypothetical protein LDL44_05275, partial [Caenispirillum sp.]|nr:hypothetical protein [Caenispirillum sp.]
PLDGSREVLPARLVALAEAANHLFERLHAVHIAIVPGDAVGFADLPQTMDEAAEGDVRVYA